MRNLFVIFILIGLMAGGCVNDNYPDTPYHQTTQQNAKSFISVRLMSPGNNFTRASDDEYISGIQKENYVKHIRFYFFNDNGDPVEVAFMESNESSTYAYYDWFLSKLDNDNSGNDIDNQIEKELNTEIAIIKQGATLPKRLIAIVNPPEELLIKGNLKQSELTSLISDYKTGLTDYNFVMSNSVYLSRDNKLYDYSPIEDKNIGDNLDDARNNPIIIYVERVAARLDINFNIESQKIGEDDFVYDTGITFQPLDNPDIEKPVYVKLLGWNITSTPSISRLVKSIDVKWPTDMFGSDIPWFISDYHRSFWAINPKEMIYDWCSYNEIFGGNSTAIKGALITEQTLYMQENANPYEGNAGRFSDPLYPTKVIVAAQLIDEEGKPLTIAEYQKQMYTIDGLKRLAANKLNLFTEDTENKGYTKIKPEQIDFLTRSEWSGKSGPDETGGYFVYFILNEKAKDLNWFTSPSNGLADIDDFVAIDKEKINQYIYDSINRAMVWNNGATYYHFNIRHLGATFGKPGFYGVVRNHIYKTTVTQIAGIGTPVYNPRETIYPENVDRSGSIFAAKIEVLQWREVTGSYEFSW